MGVSDSRVVADDDLSAPLPWIHRRRGRLRQPAKVGERACHTACDFSRGRARAGSKDAPSILGPHPCAAVAVTSTAPPLGLSPLENNLEPSGPGVVNNRFGPLAADAHMGQGLDLLGSVTESAGAGLSEAHKVHIQI